MNDVSGRDRPRTNEEGIGEGNPGRSDYAKSPRQIKLEEEVRAAAERSAREEAVRRQLQADAEARQAIERAKFEALHPPKPNPPLINFRFIGKMGTTNSMIAVLEEASPGVEKYTVGEGEAILDKYKLLKIDYDSVIIGYTNPEWAQSSKVIKMGG